ncbi:MAG: HAD-IA family hydrolase [Chloroflexota bacterium]
MSPNKIYTTVFFDMGSTLVDLNPSWKTIYHQIFQKAGYDLPFGEVEQAIDYSWGIVSNEDHTANYETTLEASRAWQREVEKRVMERLGLPPRVHDEIFWKIIEAFEDPATYPLYPETRSVLERLKAEGYRLGIISNWGWHLPELCNSLGLTQYFEVILTSARVGCPKPQPRIFETALSQIKAEPHQAFHIGDTFKSDIEGAWKVNMAALWLDRRNEQLHFEKKGPLTPLQRSIRIESLNEIWTFLETGVPKAN